MTMPTLWDHLPMTKERDVERLVPLARELAKKAGRDGVIIADLRIVAVQRGILTGAETGRALSYLASVMKRAGLVATKEFRRSHIDKSHGNLHRVWSLP